MRKTTKNTTILSTIQIKGFALVLSALLLLLSLISFHPTQGHFNLLGLLGHGVGWILTYIAGIGSWLIPLFIGWIGIQWMAKKETEKLSIAGLYFACLVFSLSMLLSMLSAALPTFAALFKNWIHTHHQDTTIHYYLGGAPLYHLYNDAAFNLRQFLGAFGSFIIFAALFLLSCMLLLQLPFEKIIHQIKNLAKSSLPKKIALLPVRKLPFEKEELIELQVDETPPLVREDPLKKITRIKIAETKPSPKPLALPKATVGQYQIPPPSLLTEVTPVDQSSLKNDLKRQARLLEDTLLSFGIEAKVGDIHCGPTITSFEVHPAVGVKVQKIKTLENDIALNLQAKSIRIIAPIPGKAAVGIEVPNPAPQEVSFRTLLESYLSQRKNAHIPLLLGKMVNGDDMWADLTKMPHLIIAGATGSGKSVCINTIVMSIVMNARPDEIKLVMIDPKKVELTAYTHLPHMLAPVITEPGGACAALGWLVKEMEKRYEIFRQLGIRNIHGFNTRKVNAELETSLELNIPEKMSFIVVIIDELADLMMVSSSDIETPIARIAQMARAVGIHLILATQRPSREVITGLIKANFPCRIAFKVSSRINSQIIIDENGAETLLGNGDMLFMPPGTSTLSRAQGAFIRDDDINQVIHFCCSQHPTNYLIPSFDTYREPSDSLLEDDPAVTDPLYDEAKKLVFETGNASTTFLQRKMKIGYARAASLMDMMELQGVVGPSEGAKPRKIYYPAQEDDES